MFIDSKLILFSVLPKVTKASIMATLRHYTVFRLISSQRRKTINAIPSSAPGTQGRIPFIRVEIAVCAIFHLGHHGLTSTLSTRY